MPALLQDRPRDLLLFGTSPDRYGSKALLLFLGVYVGAFALAGLLAPPLFFLVQALATGEGAAAVWWRDQEFDRYVDRLRLAFSLAAVLWLISYCRLWGRFGFRWNRRGVEHLGLGFVGGALSLGLVVALHWVLLDPRPRAPVDWVEVILGSLASGLAVGFLEEALFRGMLLRLFYTALRPVPALVLCALVYAAAHFKKVAWDHGDPVGWLTGFDVAWRSFLAVVYRLEALPFLNLFLAGLVLGLLFVRTRSLMAPFGLHAGWVFIRNGAGNAYDLHAPGPTLLATEKITDGWIATFVLLAILLPLLFRSGRADDVAEPGASGARSPLPA